MLVISIKNFWLKRPSMKCSLARNRRLKIVSVLFLNAWTNLKMTFKLYVFLHYIALLQAIIRDMALASSDCTLFTNLERILRHLITNFEFNTNLWYLLYFQSSNSVTMLVNQRYGASWLCCKAPSQSSQYPICSASHSFLKFNGCAVPWVSLYLTTPDLF